MHSRPSRRSRLAAAGACARSGRTTRPTRNGWAWDCHYCPECIDDGTVAGAAAAVGDNVGDSGIPYWAPEAERDAYSTGMSWKWMDGIFS